MHQISELQSVWLLALSEMSNSIFLTLFLKVITIQLHREARMKLNIIQIGNSQGIRLPKVLIEACGFRNSVEVKLEDGHLVLFPSSSSREGWDKAFQKMHARQDDELIDQETLELESDDQDWVW
jgi:antitoxin MazE